MKRVTEGKKEKKRGVEEENKLREKKDKTLENQNLHKANLCYIKENEVCWKDNV